MPAQLPNETPCPVPLEVLALLLRSDVQRIDEISLSIPEVQRAALAAFCYSRAHMRTLSFRIARSCDVRSLRLAAGLAAEGLISQSHSWSEPDAAPRFAGRKVTSTRFAA